jgi:hypothetical protein
MTQNRAVNQQALEDIHRQLLEPKIIAAIAEMENIGVRNAMDIYYRSRLSRQVDEGIYGIHYLDARYLAEDVRENEPELFGRPKPV